MNDETLKTIQATVASMIANSGCVNLDHHAFDRIPCTRRQLYAAVKKNAAGWEYRYLKAKYSASGAGAFGRYYSGRRGHSSKPHVMVK